ncbi:MAG: TRAP transporter permease [Lachnospiraceae bacterium]|nr:TRAP transporter permease [Lachnospiraceae bacterium]
MENLKKKLSKGEEIVKNENSKTRTFVGIPNIIMTIILVFFSLLSIYIVFLSPFDTRINRASFVGMIVACIYLLYPVSQKIEKRINHIPVYDLILAILSLICYGYFVFNCRYIIDVGMRLTPLMMYIGGLGVILTLEACRRATGIPIVIVASFFIIYGLMNNSLKRVIYDLFYTTEGVIGTPIRACTAFISLFVIFGAFLERTGISDFFINLANSIAGHSVGGPAKVAVISSALCGMVSGSSVGNTVTTGAITIPLMKKNGYKPEFAGAVEAAASTGGQIMPPIMGAAAFLMIEYTNKEYSFIALRACLPALLYFAGIFISVHLEARKLGLKGIPKSELPKFKDVIKSWYLVLPLVTLTYLIIKSTMAKAALIAILVAIALSVVRDMFLDYNGKEIISEKKKAKLLVITQTTPTLIIKSLAAGAKSVISVGIACSVAGIIACIITTTGIGTELVSAIVGLSKGNILIGMFLTMITCIILGMGVPTTANYVIMATTCAPILIGMNMNAFAAHMFVFYFGIVADITPPVALAAYAGSAIANASPIKTAINATLLAIAAFIVPYIFGLNPAMLFIDTNPIEVIVIIITSLVGIFGVSAGIRGFIIRHMNPLERILIIISGLLLIYPGIITDVIGLVTIAALVAIQNKTKKKILI